MVSLVPMKMKEEDKELNQGARSDKNSLARAKRTDKDQARQKDLKHQARQKDLKHQALQGDPMGNNTGVRGGNKSSKKNLLNLVCHKLVNLQRTVLTMHLISRQLKKRKKK